MDDRKLDFKEKKNTFSAQGKNQHKRRLNNQNFVYFLKRSSFDGKNCQKV